LGLGLQERLRKVGRTSYLFIGSGFMPGSEAK
jgi:hypothetical protein